MEEFKTIGQLVVFLEGSEDTTLDKDWVIETLKGIASSRKTSGQRRGQLAGLTLEQMDDEQLKREIINSKSVLYKAVQRGASEDTISKNQARVDAALAEKAKRTPVAEAPAEEVYAEGETNEAVEAEL